MDAALHIDGELGTLRIPNRFNILTLQALAQLEGLAEQMDVSVQRDLTDEGHAPSGDRQRFRGHAIAWG